MKTLVSQKQPATVAVDLVRRCYETPAQPRSQGADSCGPACVCSGRSGRNSAVGAHVHAHAHGSGHHSSAAAGPTTT